MKTLTIKDLSATEELGSKEMSAVRGGIGNQANATQQGNMGEIFAPVEVANGANFGGSGPVTFQVTSAPSLEASNYSRSSNRSGFPHFFPF